MHALLGSTATVQSVESPQEHAQQVLKIVRADVADLTLENIDVNKRHKFQHKMSPGKASTLLAIFDVLSCSEGIAISDYVVG